MGKKFKVGGGTTNYFCAVFGHSSQVSQNYYIAISVERQVWFGDTIQISLVSESSVLCHQNHAKIFSSERVNYIMKRTYKKVEQIFRKKTA